MENDAQRGNASFRKRLRPLPLNRAREAERTFATAGVITREPTTMSHRSSPVPGSISAAVADPTLALLTGGGDAPGMNAAIRTVVRTAE